MFTNSATVEKLIVVGGVFWGLGWKGNHEAGLQALTNASARLGWDPSALSGDFAGQVGIIYDAGLGTPERPSDMTCVGVVTKPDFAGTMFMFQ